MDIKDQIKNMADRIQKIKPQVATEEATKNAFIMPMLQILGYDVFNPLEVVPEFTADIGIKRGEKIDYAILRDGKVLILVECKHWEKKLDEHEGQLVRYFQAANARFGVLTNGIVYRFYTDLDKPNLMDAQPFFEFDVTDIKDNQIEELKKFHKDYFDLDKIVNTASDLKYTAAIKNLIQNEFVNPSEWFVRGIAKLVYQGVVTVKVLEQFTALTKKSLTQVVSDMITDRLKSALIQEEAAIQAAEPVAAEAELSEKTDNGIVTTEEELEGFYTVRAVLRHVASMDRIVYRDAQTYFAILLDDNNRKPICRLYFNGAKKYIATFDDNKKEIRHELAGPDGIFDHVDAMSRTIKRYDSLPKSATAEMDSATP